MNTRYLILVREAGLPHDRFDEVVARGRRAFADAHPKAIGRATIITNRFNARTDLPSFGAIIGEVFSQNRPFRPMGGAGIGSADIPEHLWGNYIAVRGNDASLSIDRAPMGMLSAYYCSLPGCVAIASDPMALVAGDLLTPELDWLEIARTHFARDLPTGLTALVGLSELLPGQRLSISPANGLRLREQWSPWSHVQHDPEAHSPEALRRVVAETTATLVSPYRRPLLGLSGGLDSSIVAACLAERTDGFAALTMYNRGPGGDERKFARSVAAITAADLIERPYRLSDIDLERSVAQHQPRPCGWIHETAYQATIFRAAVEADADVFVTGNGGDNVFYNSSSARVVVDRALTSGLSSDLLRSIGDVARLTEASPWQVVREAWRLFRRTGRSYRWSPSAHLLDRALVGTLEQTVPTHPWLDAPRNALPGKSGQVAMLLRMHYHLDLFDRIQSVPIVHPLAAQPVVEFCLGLPSWASISGGRDRVAARTAFAGHLPVQIASRRSKGSPDGFALELVEARLPTIRERLLEGEMMRRKMLDRAAVEHALAPSSLRDRRERPLLMALLDTEAWIAHWQALAYSRVKV